ncbi:MAG: dethiobiotin synthase [Verrucomicrobiota bacterium]
MNQNYFITGTDTGVGKTHITALLLAELRRRGLPAAGFKPIACGTGGRADARTYRKLMRNEVPLDVINPVYLRHPVAPSVAAKLEGSHIDTDRIQSIFRVLAIAFRPVLVEGAGGLLVPIKKMSFRACEGVESDETPPRQSLSFRGETLRQAQGDKVKKTRPYFVADLARQLDLPVIIVARLGLGTLNHTLLTVRQAQAMKLKVAGVILNDTTGKRGLAERTNVKAIAELTGVPLLGVVPHGDRGKDSAVRAIVDRLYGER